MTARLPKPRLTATVLAPVRAGELGAVIVRGYVLAPRPRREREIANRPHRCTVCGGPHNKRNRLCPGKGGG